MSKQKQHFEVGQFAEARSFIPGFRGAWFRCKVISITEKKKRLGYDLEYFDFPDEKVTWTELFKTHNGRNYVMIRPTYPDKCRQSEIPEKHPSSVTVALNDTWKVNDAVDWWTTTSFWSGWITKALDNGNYMVELWPPPDGEGESYVASGDDFRPTLVWSPDSGWTLPEENGLIRPCCQLIQPLDNVDEIEEEIGEISVDNGGESEVFEGSIEGHSPESLNCEDAILDIIELLYKVKWMKRHLCGEQ